MRSKAGRLEELTNSVFNSDLQAQLRTHSTSYVQEQFKLLFEAIQNIPGQFKKEDRVTQRVDQMLATVKQQADDITEQRAMIAVLQQERDVFRDETKELNSIKTTLAFDKAALARASKEKIAFLLQK